MAWRNISQIEDEGLRLTFIIWGYVGVDMERKLVLTTTDGHTRNARRWFVHAMNDKYERQRDDKVTFRAWTTREAVERLSEPRIQKRIEKLIAGTSAVRE